MYHLWENLCFIMGNTTSFFILSWHFSRWLSFFLGAIISYTINNRAEVQAEISNFFVSGVRTHCRSGIYKFDSRRKRIINCEDNYFNLFNLVVKKIAIRVEIIILRDCTNSFGHLSSNEFLDWLLSTHSLNSWANMKFGQ